MFPDTSATGLQSRHGMRGSLAWIGPTDVAGLTIHHRSGHRSGSSVTAPSSHLIAAPRRELMQPDSSGNARPANTDSGSAAGGQPVIFSSNFEHFP